MQISQRTNRNAIFHIETKPDTKLSESELHWHMLIEVQGNEVKCTHYNSTLSEIGVKNNATNKNG